VASPPWFIFLHECIDLHRGQVLMRVFTQCLIEIDIMRRCMPLVLPFTGRADLARHPTFVTAYIWHTRSEEEVVEQEHVVAARAIIAISAKGRRAGGGAHVVGYFRRALRLASESTTLYHLTKLSPLVARSTSPFRRASFPRVLAHLPHHQGSNAPTSRWSSTFSDALYAPVWHSLERSFALRYRRECSQLCP